MAQHSNEHLTIAELSAYIDEELAPEELVRCDAHIQTCQLCQAALADLRLTSALLSSTPQVAVPRSFVLPTNIVILPETPDVAVEKKMPVRRSSTPASAAWRRSIRTACTLVAVLGLCFCLVGALSTLRGTTATSSASMGSSVPHATSLQATQTPDTTSSVQTQPSPNALATRKAATAAAVETPRPIKTQTAYDSTPGQSSPQPPELPAALDLSQPAGRLTIGAALLFLGILGVIVTHLLDRAANP